MAGRDEWTDIAAGDADDLRERILTGYKTGKPFTPYVPTIALPAPIDSVLDFGCGLGRNFPVLENHRGQGGRIRPAADGGPVPCAGGRKGRTTSALIGRTCVSGVRLVFASLVLQHIETDECRDYLADFAGMSPHVYLLTRTRTDFDAVMLDLIAESGLYRRAPAASSITIPSRISSHHRRPNVRSGARVAGRRALRDAAAVRRFHNRNGGVPRTNTFRPRSPARRNTPEK